MVEMNKAAEREYSGCGMKQRCVRWRVGSVAFTATAPTTASEDQPPVLLLICSLCIDRAHIFTTVLASTAVVFHEDIMTARQSSILQTRHPLIHPEAKPQERPRGTRGKHCISWVQPGAQKSSALPTAPIPQHAVRRTQQRAADATSSLSCTHVVVRVMLATAEALVSGHCIRKRRCGGRVRCSQEPTMPGHAMQDGHGSFRAGSRLFHRLSTSIHLHSQHLGASASARACLGVERQWYQHTAAALHRPRLPHHHHHHQPA